MLICLNTFLVIGFLAHYLCTIWGMMMIMYIQYVRLSAVNSQTSTL